MQGQEYILLGIKWVEQSEWRKLSETSCGKWHLLSDIYTNCARRWKASIFL